MTALNFVDEFVIEKVVAADSGYESDVAPSDSDINFESINCSGADDFDSDDETPLANLVKDVSSNNKNDNLNSLQSNNKKKTYQDYRWSSMKERTSITQNTNFSDKGMSDIEVLNLVIDYFKLSFTDEMLKHMLIHAYAVLNKIIPRLGLQ